MKFSCVNVIVIISPHGLQEAFDDDECLKEFARENPKLLAWAGRIILARAEGMRKRVISPERYIAKSLPSFFRESFPSELSEWASSRLSSYICACLDDMPHAGFHIKELRNYLKKRCASELGFREVWLLRDEPLDRIIVHAVNSQYAIWGRINTEQHASGTWFMPRPDAKPSSYSTAKYLDESERRTNHPLWCLAPLTEEKLKAIADEWQLPEFELAADGGGCMYSDYDVVGLIPGDPEPAWQPGWNHA